MKMNNKTIISQLNKIVKLLTLANENPHKIKAFQRAIDEILKNNHNLLELFENKKLTSVKGIGKSLEKEIITIITTGKSELLSQLEQKFPEEITLLIYLDVLTPKTLAKIYTAYKPQTAEEILELINQNKLSQIKGFGAKTQEKIKNKLLFFLQNKGKWLLHYAVEYFNSITALFPGKNIKPAGDLLTYNPVVGEFLVITDANIPEIKEKINLTITRETSNKITFQNENYQTITFISTDNVVYEQLKNSLPANFSEQIEQNKSVKSLEKFWQNLDYKQIPTPELYDNPEALELAKNGELPELISYEDLQGAVHIHSTYSDGKNSLQEMVEEAQKRGFKYIVISDHSQYAAYANGLTPERLKQQKQEINNLQEKLDIKIIQGNETDILPSGDLDYDEETLRQLEIVIASVHSGLNMSEEKATKRLLKAINNPETNIIGHISGRLLLKRPGYPLDYEKIFDAAKNKNVAIEYNANPYRMDIDLAFLPTMKKLGIKTVLTPDAHSIQDFDFLKTGAIVLRKALLTKEDVANTYSYDSFLAFFK